MFYRSQKQRTGVDKNHEGENNKLERTEENKEQEEAKPWMSTWEENEPTNVWKEDEDMNVFALTLLQVVFPVSFRVFSSVSWDRLLALIAEILRLLRFIKAMFGSWRGLWGPTLQLWLQLLQRRQRNRNCYRPRWSGHQWATTTTDSYANVISSYYFLVGQKAGVITVLRSSSVCASAASSYVVCVVFGVSS